MASENKKMEEIYTSSISNEDREFAKVFIIKYCEVFGSMYKYQIVKDIVSHYESFVNSKILNDLNQPSIAKQIEQLSLTTRLKRESVRPLSIRSSTFNMMEGVGQLNSNEYEFVTDEESTYNMESLPTTWGPRPGKAYITENSKTGDPVRKDSSDQPYVFL